MGFTLGYGWVDLTVPILLSRCQGMAPSHDFRFDNPLYSLDASTIDLCLSVFPWGDFRTTKGAGGDFDAIQFSQVSGNITDADTQAVKTDKFLLDLVAESGLALINKLGLKGASPKLIVPRLSHSPAMR